MRDWAARDRPSGSPGAGSAVLLLAGRVVGKDALEPRAGRIVYPVLGPFQLSWLGPFGGPLWGYIGALSH